jgi:hypothetical protein
VDIRRGMCLNIKYNSITIADNDHQALWLDRKAMILEVGEEMTNRVVDVLRQHLTYNNTSNIITLLGALSIQMNSSSPTRDIEKIVVDKNKDRYFLCDNKTILVTKDRIEYVPYRSDAIHLPYFFLSFWGLHLYERIHIITVFYCNTFMKQNDGQIYYPKNNMDMIYLEWDKIHITIATRTIDSLDNRYPVIYSSDQGYMRVSNIKDEDCTLCTENNHNKYMPVISRCRTFIYNGYKVSVSEKGIYFKPVRPRSIYSKYTPIVTDVVIEYQQ